MPQIGLQRWSLIFGLYVGKSTFRKNPFANVQILQMQRNISILRRRQRGQKSRKMKFQRVKEPDEVFRYR